MVFDNVDGGRSKGGWHAFLFREILIWTQQVARCQQCIQFNCRSQRLRLKKIPFRTGAMDHCTAPKSS